MEIITQPHFSFPYAVIDDDNNMVGNLWFKTRDEADAALRDEERRRKALWQKANPS